MEISHQIMSAAKSGGEWPDGYFYKTLEFLTSTDQLTREAVIDNLIGSVMWRHIVKQMSPAVRAQIILEMQPSDRIPPSRLYPSCMVRAYLCDETLVEQMNHLVFDRRHIEYDWCRVLGPLRSTKSREILVGMLDHEKASVRLEAALSLAKRGDNLGEEIIHGNINPVWYEDGQGIRVATALARLNNLAGIAFVFSTYGEYLRSWPSKLLNFVNNLRRTVNDFEELVDCGSDDWLNQYLATLATRVNERLKNQLHKD
jgi:hypothetical protein